MSELIDKNDNRATIRWKLLTSASALVLAAYVSSAGMAEAANGDHDVVWIELGGAFDQLSADDSRWLPPNLPPMQSSPPPGPFGSLPVSGYDADLKLSFAPDNSDWVFSAALRYGRAVRGPKHTHDQASKFITFSQRSSRPTNYDFANTSQRSRASHAVVDFMAGKDVGLGIFGHGKSTIDFGVRFAQLNEGASGQLTAFTNAHRKYVNNGVGHKAEFTANRSFTGIGPSISWDASAPLAGSPAEGFSIDWGANAALLFGRQKSKTLLRTRNAEYHLITMYTQYGNRMYTQYGNFHTTHQTVLSQSTQKPARAKTVLVPNLGGFAALSWRLSDFKVSLGYRADFFFGAIDGGLETRKSENRGFYGPFASVSVGVGD